MKTPRIILTVVCLSFVFAKAATAQGSQQAPPVQPDVSVEAPDRAGAHEYLRAGDEAFKKNDFLAAELEYRRALQQEPSFKAQYNLGLSLANQGRGEEAAAAFQRAERMADAPEDAVDANFNAGNAHVLAEDLKASAESYIEALRKNPNDREAKENLTQILKQLRLQQPPPEQQQQPQEGDAEEQEGESEQNQESQAGGEAEESEDEAQQEDENESEEPQPDSEGQGNPQDFDKEEAERLLDMAREQERKTKEKLRNGKQSPRKPEKDW